MVTRDYMSTILLCTNTVTWSRSVDGCSLVAVVEGASLGGLFLNTFLVESNSQETRKTRTINYVE